MPSEEFNIGERQPDPRDGAGRESRALIALSPIDQPTECTCRYRSAPFLAQLVATKDRHPQTRERGRAEPAMASAVYRAVAALTAD